MSELIFEKVGDINNIYPYLCVYLKGHANPFMDITINNKNLVEFFIYKNEVSITLEMGQWNEILKRAEKFLPEALENVSA
ncbi:hypothetical protein QN362_17675 [Actimicrobium sp. CCC2.4]|uniref:hypothetical protein n=1 Tax=Actimicrobium sp. CCC2.4 TaxID=3048606 RepID=UPI002AC90D88|nr:hypothetical protein [Actimicrobium sp. CCC2.4]MEB0137165.1 hypothetical protein [Actimicrobium sp. CCC2.4]WPX30902.1 hypothetical protein RHM62_11575 [Actimicrobium sp. CCC2.4]